MTPMTIALILGLVFVSAAFVSLAAKVFRPREGHVPADRPQISTPPPPPVRTIPLNECLLCGERGGLVDCAGQLQCADSEACYERAQRQQAITERHSARAKRKR